eukprot:CAMPEP_0118920716 /NCGR_PEP_ID=MMETSP1169-20130426/145_1 /TAXON_ID=36882 /ORGANISM="Pyramimonas obovata, Strain CCMP722" /LENGTH=168 /DNA_ID=CAMNT_0006861289 /DNA_START=266 /DNA_END=772 /DNA_ORIENTATION=+
MIEVANAHANALFAVPTSRASGREDPTIAPSSFDELLGSSETTSFATGRSESLERISELSAVSIRVAGRRGSKPAIAPSSFDELLGSRSSSFALARPESLEKISELPACPDELPLLDYVPLHAQPTPERRTPGQIPPSINAHTSTLFAVPIKATDNEKPPSDSYSNRS